MPQCCAWGCTNTRVKGFKLYSLPTGSNDTLRRNLWLSKIRRDFTPTRNAVVCEAHFEPDQFERRVPGKLKRDAVPTIFPQHIFPEKRKHARKQFTSPETSLKHEPIFTSSTEKYFESETVHTSKDSDVQTHPDGIDSDENPMSLNSSSLEDEDLQTYELLELNRYVSDVVDQQNSVKKQHSTISEQLASVKTYLEATREKLYQVQKEKETLETKLKNLFNPDQIRFLELDGNSYLKWSNKTLEKALQLRISCGFHGYDMLLSQGYPLPSHKTLRKTVQNISLESDVISNVINRLINEVPSTNDEEDIV